MAEAAAGISFNVAVSGSSDGTRSTSFEVGKNNWMHCASNKIEFAIFYFTSLSPIFFWEIK